MPSGLGLFLFFVKAGIGMKKSFLLGGISAGRPERSTGIGKMEKKVFLITIAIFLMMVIEAAATVTFTHENIYGECEEFTATDTSGRYDLSFSKVSADNCTDAKALVTVPDDWYIYGCVPNVWDSGEYAVHVVDTVGNGRAYYYYNVDTCLLDWETEIYLGNEIPPPHPPYRICEKKGDPINILSGNLVEKERDILLPSPFHNGLVFKRYYNSQSTLRGDLGYGWSHSFSAVLTTNYKLDYSLIKIQDESGRGVFFSTTDNINFTGLYGEKSSVLLENNEYVWQRNDNLRYFFNEYGYLIKIGDQKGNQLDLSYDSENRLKTVLDQSSNRSLTFFYNADNHLEYIVGPATQSIPDGIWVSFEYDSNNLISATYADGSGFDYAYDDSYDIHNMTQKSDKAGYTISTWSYNDRDKAIENVNGEGTGVTVNFVSETQVDVTDAYDVTRSYTIDSSIDGRKRIVQVQGPDGCSTCNEDVIRIEYDTSGRIVEKEYANGRIDQFSDFDGRGNAGTAIQAVGTADEKTITSTWHPTLNVPLTATESSVLGTGNKVTTWDYDDDGNTSANESPTTLVHRIVVNGFTQNSSGSVVAVESITNFSYDSHGQLLSVDGPLDGSGDTTTFTYDATTSDLLTVTRPVSGTTTFSGYDAAGRPGQAVDPNQNGIAYTYDGRGRLLTLTRLWDNAVTSYTYNLAGKLDTVSLANGVALTYTYESLYGRLTGITDALGNRVSHSYDDQGNVTETGYYLPSDVRSYLAQFDYQYPDRPGKLWKRINPDDTFFEYAYDAMGNLNQVTDPEGKITTYGHDLFNRMTTMVQPGTVTTGYAYDSQGNLVLVTDPEARETEYVVDDLGRTVKVVSPDTGTTNYAFDTAGNLVSKTDANDVAVTYNYDDEHRLTGIQYPDSTQDVTYTYDEGTNGKGRLTGMSDQSGSFVYGYDEAGNLIREDRSIEGRLYTTAYAYDAAGLLTGMTYPNGRSVAYELDAAGRVTRVTTTLGGTAAVVAENLSYKPFGPLTEYTNGNGIQVTSSFDENYRPTGITAGTAMDLAYTLDAVGNVTAITDALDSTRSQSFGYDDLYRITSASGVYGTVGYTYDQTGNRLTRMIDDQTDTYQYLSGTGRLQAITGTNPGSFTFDAAGNMTASSGTSYVYNQNNRLIRATDAAGTLGEYVYSANGQRIKTTTANGTTIFHYDQAGNLIGESTLAGDFIAAYIYLGLQRLAAAAATPVDEVAVMVTTSEGSVLAGINVYAFTENGAYTGKSAVTDESGKAGFTLEDLSDGNYKFRADYLSDQFWTDVITVPDTLSTQIVIVEKAVTVQVTRAGVPIEGVKVYLFNEAGSYLGIVGTTEENGNVSFVLPVDQGYKFRADLLGSQFMSEVLTVTSGETNAISIHTGGGTLTLTLETGDPAPLEGVNTYLFSASGSYLAKSGQSDTNGEVAFAVPSGTYKVRADYMGYQFWTNELSVTADTLSSLVIDHQDVTMTIERVMDGDFQVQEGIPVYLFTDAGSYLGISIDTDAEGKAVFSVPSGDYKARADCLTRKYWSETFNQTDETITIAEGNALVNVTGQGLPLADVNVYAFNDSGSYLGLSGQTDSQGQVTFRLPEGSYNFRADYMSSQYFSGNTTVIAHTDNPVGISTGGGNLMLTVEKSAGDPMAGLSCYLFSAGGTYLGQKLVTSGDGEVEFNLSDGDYLIRVDYLGYQYWTEEFSSPATSATSLSIAHQDVTITVTGDYNGDVLAKEEVPVYLFTPEGTYMGLTANTDSSGEAMFSLPAKAYEIRADYLGQQYWSGTFTAEDIGIVIPEGIGSVTVTRDATLLENVNVYVFSTADAYLGLNAATDADGRVTFRLPDGAYKFRADHMGSQFWATATIEADVTNEIALSTGGGSFALTVRKSSGSALADIPVYVFSAAGSYLNLTANTDATGLVSFDLADGSYVFRVDYLGYQYWTVEYTIPNAQADVLSIAHQDVTVTVNETYGLDTSALEGVPVYLFTSGGSYMSISADTDANGQVVFSLPSADYQVRADYLSSQTWSTVFNQSDVTVDIAHGKAAVHIFDSGSDLYDIPVYLFTEAGTYLGLVERTDSAGMVEFLVPAGSYKFRADYDGSQAWSGAINLLADEETSVDMDLDLLLSDMTLNPDPIRFDGIAPEYAPEKPMLATFGTLTGLLPESLGGQPLVDKFYFFINDHRGTPMIVTEETGTVVWKADYQPFGRVDIATGDIENNLRFAGQYFDAETGLHYNYHRYYDPATGRYLTPDPIGLVGGINLFAYVRNNPVNFVDPYGLFVKHAFENALPSWLRDSRSDAERESAHQEYNQDIGDRLSEVWDLTKTVTYPEKTIFWAPFHTYDKFSDQYPNDSYFDPWHHHYDSHEEDTDPCK
jgi:RHS repeat-associated protein